MVLHSLDGHFCLFVLLNYRLLLMLLLRASGRLLLRAVVALQLSDVLGRMRVGTIVSKHLDRLLSFLITDKFTARVVHRENLRVVIFDFLDNFGHVGGLSDYLLGSLLLLLLLLLLDATALGRDRGGRGKAGFVAQRALCLQGTDDAVGAVGSHSVRA